MTPKDHMSTCASYCSAVRISGATYNGDPQEVRNVSSSKFFERPYRVALEVREADTASAKGRYKVGDLDPLLRARAN
jgi:hypothetical protein